MTINPTSVTVDGELPACPDHGPDGIELVDVSTFSEGPGTRYLKTCRECQREIDRARGLLDADLL